ncbi:MDP1 [Symbiodinium natans]|uniref:MDP1 protein n=1 Tax=Symbiodinium natans TaxID=878477 RepID=A0A812L4U2_9DINO|nr:MDP1 [Symbiodinium natans]
MHFFPAIDGTAEHDGRCCQATLVHSPRGRGSLRERMAGASYTAFFPLSAAAFLCICQYWLRLIDFMDQAVEKPWYQNPLILLCLLFLILEAAHDCMYLQGEHFVLEGLYFFWLSALSVGAAFLGVSIAWCVSKIRLQTD